MIGTIRWNLVVGFIAFLFTFICSISSNIWLTTILRSLYSFVIVFILMFLFRWILGTIVGLNQFMSEEPKREDVPDESHKGTALDVTTPDDEDSIHQMLKEGLDQASAVDDQFFSPLSPPKLTTKPDYKPEELAKALRQMSEE
jgi:energy-coupling factor transporter transmembrane protein EcfT